MSTGIFPAIDEQLCTGCGACVEVCPDNTLSVEDGIARIRGEKCMQCGHCMAVCPVEAVTVSSLDDFSFSTFSTTREWLPFGEGDTGILVQLMRSRRSCRNYTDEPVQREKLEDLVKIGVSAPSGTNCQMWTFTILDNRQAVAGFGDRVARYYEGLNKLAANPLARIYSRIFQDGALERYYRRYHATVEKSLQAWKTKGEDHLFHGATAAMVVGCEKGASCPAEDALLASQNILLASHTMGLGSCLIGFAVEAMQRDKTIQQALSIPEDETVYAVIALGYPDETYHQVAWRKKIIPRWVK